MRHGIQPAPRGPAQPIEIPFRAFTAAEEAWIAYEGGRSVSGLGAAPLLLVQFAKEVEPGRLLREILTPGRALDDLADKELIRLLARSRLYEERRERREVFPEASRKGGRGT